MAKILGLPKLSPTMEEGTLVHWAKKEGDSVAVDDLLAEVETDKATMEFRSFDEGVLLKILVAEGTTLAPDQPVAILGAKGDDISALLTQVASSSSSPASSSSSGATTTGPLPSASSAQVLTATPVTPATPATQAHPPQVSHTSVLLANAPAAARPAGRVLASPLVRKLARDKSIDLAFVQGSGPKGRIIKRDLDGVQAGAGFTSGATSILPAPALEERVVPLSSMRKTIARRLTESKQQVPHFYLTIDVDAEPLMAAREQINSALEEIQQKVSVNDLIIKACALALRKVPSANASFEGTAIRYHGRVDISVAVAIAEGLVTPVVRNADRKNIVEISREVRELAQKARNKKLTPEEMTQGTFSISNLGMYGIEDFGAVINPPEGAILAVGAVREEPVVKHGAVVVGKRMRMTLSCDHRVVDGAVGAEWLSALRAYLEQPVRLFL
jgi:pyruvate dehydrogenase E2 component (dihydrolipoamide acetyltransferase)